MPGYPGEDSAGRGDFEARRGCGTAIVLEGGLILIPLLDTSSVSLVLPFISCNTAMRKTENVASLHENLSIPAS